MKNLFLLFLFAFSADGAPYEEGDFCEKDGVTGTCKLFTQCQSASEDRQKGKIPKNCGYKGSEPIVCCVPSSASNPVLTTTKSLTTTTEYIPTVADYQDVGMTEPDGCAPIPSALTANKTGQRAWDKCLEYQEKLVFPCVKSNAILGGMTRVNRCHHNADELIVGGQNAALHEFPHMVLLRYGEDNQTFNWFCGGALISEKFVLTAGHCILNRENISVAYAVLGTLRQSVDANDGQRYKIKRIIKHPDYNPPQKYNDIALLELEQSVPLDEFSVPACLHTGNKVDDSKASATGWGQILYRGPVSDLLQKVILTKFETVECSFKYPEGSHHMPNGFREDSQLCFGDRVGENWNAKDTCEGDSGGPLHVKSKDIGCMYIVIGVTSIGNKCGLRDEPGLYTKVDHFIDWIENIVWPY